MEPISVPSRSPSPSVLVPAKSAQPASSSDQNPNEAATSFLDVLRDPVARERHVRFSSQEPLAP
eukprot:2627241-Karenia_brevis.AAC.1